MNAKKPTKRWEKLSKTERDRFFAQLARHHGIDAFVHVMDLSGRGGATTFLAKSERGSGIRLVVKAGNSSQLQHEYAAINEAKLKYFNNVCDVIGTPLEQHGLMGFLMSFSGGPQATTFAHYYNDTADLEKLTAVITHLFGYVLKRDATIPEGATGSVSNVYRHRMQQLAPVLSGFLGASENLCDWWEAMAIENEAIGSSAEIFSHGDLHSRNILVSAEQPFLIDLGQAGKNHFMYDPAKLERDVRLKLLLKNRPDAAERSADFTRRFSPPPGADTALDEEFQRASAAIRCIRENASRFKVSPTGFDWDLEYQGALLFQYARAATDAELPKSVRNAAFQLAEDCRQVMQQKLTQVRRRIEPTAAKRSRARWRLAYAWLRMDQLPSGAWGKTLPQWMDSIWEGDPGLITRSPETRKNGGTDFSCMAFHNYVQFLSRFGEQGTRGALADENKVAKHLLENLSERIGAGGDFNPIRVGPIHRPTVNIRHGAMAMIALLLYSSLHGYAVVGRSELDRTALYLSQHLRDWRGDKSHVFAMFAALSKLRHLLTSESGMRQFKAGTARKTRLKLIAEIKRVLPQIQVELTKPADYPPRPPVTGTDSLTANPFFVPYGMFWRMERSGFLMYVPLLLADDEAHFLPHIENDGNLMIRLQQCLDCLLFEINQAFEASAPQRNLPKFHGQTGNVESPRDWGLGAELLALLRKPAIRRLLVDERANASAKFNLTHERLDVLCAALDEAMLRTFDKYHEQQELFKFTQSVSFSRCLDLPNAANVDFDQLLQIDQALSLLLAQGLTERSLHEFTSRQIFEIPDSTPPDEATAKSIAAVRDLLLERLQSGEYTPDKRICLPGLWEIQIEKAVRESSISFYDGKGGLRYAGRYGQNPNVELLAHFPRVFRHSFFTGLHALDVACGPGQYALLLQNLGFKVDLYDASAQMLKLAAKRIGAPRVKPRNYYSLATECRDAQYDLVFACGMMVHVPLRLVDGIYSQFYRILKPGGVLFLNYKIGDHSLIAKDGRYYQYYRDREASIAKLRAAGFREEVVIESKNRQTLDHAPRDIRWANVFLVK